MALVERLERLPVPRPDAAPQDLRVLLHHPVHRDTVRPAKSSARARTAPRWLRRPLGGVNRPTTPAPAALERRGRLLLGLVGLLALLLVLVAGLGLVLVALVPGVLVLLGARLPGRPVLPGDRPVLVPLGDRLVLVLLGDRLLLVLLGDRLLLVLLGRRL